MKLARGQAGKVTWGQGEMHGRHAVPPLPRTRGRGVCNYYIITKVVCFNLSRFTVAHDYFCARNSNVPLTLL